MLIFNFLKMLTFLIKHIGFMLRKLSTKYNRTINGGFILN